MKLKPLPPVAIHLMRLVADPECSFQRVSKLIRTDAAFSVEVLRIANSPLFGSRGRIDDIKRALLMLGLDRLKSLIMTVALRNFLSSRQQDSALRRCWRHSLACACACEEMADAAGMDKSAAYTSGLLHDIGRLALLASYPNEYARMLEVDDECGFDIMDSEKDLFELDHCEAGAWLVREWGLPKELENIAGHHHEVPPVQGFGQFKIIQLSCRLADALGFGPIVQTRTTFDEVKAIIPSNIMEALGDEAEFMCRIGERTISLERDLLI